MEGFGKNLNRLATNQDSPSQVSNLDSISRSEGETAPLGWAPPARVARFRGVDYSLINKIGDEHRETHPEWFKSYKLRSAKQGVTEFYSPELIKVIDGILDECQSPPANWMTSNSLAQELGRSFATVEKAAAKYKVSRPNWFKLYRTVDGTHVPREHYSPELAAEVRSQLSKYDLPPPGWVTNGYLADKFGMPNGTVLKIASESGLTDPGRSKKHRSPNGPVRTYYSPELVQKVSETIQQYQASWAEEKNSRELNKVKFDELHSLEKAGEAFFEEVAHGETITAQEFKTLLSIFGSSHAFDILYKYHPEFEGISQKTIKGTLAKYLGDFLILNRGFNLDDLDLAYPYLSDQSFRGSLFEILKEDCLSHYHERKLQDPTVDDGTIIAEHLGILRQKAASINSPELLEVVERTEAYYRSLLEDFQKPQHLVDQLQEGRPFPDLNQTLNIKEISEKKRMLIGDEMGMGKSASAIFSKENLGSKLALVVVPSNVVSTWENYLSDKTSEQGERVGYFKEGQSPRVLMVEDLDSLAGLDTSQYDYVLISQEKITGRYTELLRELQYDMLILDEVHKFKNLAGGIRSHNMLELAETLDPDNEYLVMLSGTPIPNKIHDVAMVLKLLYPDRFKNIEDAELVESVIQGDLVDIRSLLVPRMQMKTLRESIKMPELLEETSYVELSKEEKDIYEILLEDDELTADQKIRAFRKFVMNPLSLEVTPNVEGTKIKNVNARLNDVFAEKDKVILFVNGYVNGMIRGDNTILEQMQLPKEVTVRVIDGTTSKEDRDVIQDEFKYVQAKILLAVSGQTADVGVDFSAAEHMEFYNDPWTLYEKKQQIARGYRPGLQNDLTVSTSVTSGTIEEGIQEYIQLKYDAIQKVLKGVPITEIEKGILRTAEKQRTQDIEGSLEIAKEWLNSPQNRLHRFFGVTKEIGEEHFHEFLLQHGDEYADSYLDLGRLGFQANTSRIVGTFINQFVKDEGKDPNQIRVLDIASGPEMLRKHIVDDLQGSVYSLDINPKHFSELDEKRVVGSFTDLPFADKSFDYANLSLALHYTRLLPRRGDYERIAVLTEMNRVLKHGGRGVMNLLYSMEFKDEEEFSNLANSLGFKVVEKYTGEVSSGPNYKSPIIVLEKYADIEADFDELVKTLPKAQINGAKFRDTGISSLKNGRKFVRTLKLNEREIEIQFNSEDEKVLTEQESILAEGEALRERYENIRDIPKEEILDNNFLRIYNGRNYRLLKKSELLGTFVDVR